MLPRNINIATPVQIYIHTATATAKSFQSCPTLCDPIDGIPPGSPVPGILQARPLEWVAIFLSLDIHKTAWTSKIVTLSFRDLANLGQESW